jgi:hypothetical protein
MGRGLLEVKVKQPALEVLTVAICSIQDVEDILPIQLNEKNIKMSLFDL